MKYLILFFLSFSVSATEMCDVKICNKIERLTLNPFTVMRDSMAESCFNTTVPKDMAVVGKELSSESRWYQGSTINPTKKSVTRIKEVYACTEVE